MGFLSDFFVDSDVHTLIQSKEYRPEIPIHEVCLITSKTIPYHSLDLIFFSIEIFFYASPSRLGYIVLQS